MSIDCAFYGFLAADAEQRTSQAGKPWTRLRVGFGKDESVQWLQVACFGKAAEAAANLKKSDRCYIEGSIKLDTWQAGDLSYIATVSRFDDGRLGEIFLTNHKAGSAADTAARDAAITCSIALQFGADVETIRKALCRGSRGNANGPLGVALDILAVQS